VRFTRLSLLVLATGCGDAIPPRPPAARAPVASVVDAATPDVRPVVDQAKIARKAEDALQFARSHGLSTQYVILIDMSLHSGVRRFFLWSFAEKRVEHAALVSHGCCDKPWGAAESRARPGFSNAVGSHCTALGKYRIGARQHTSWGIGVKYELHGLEASNDNALARYVVLHGWDAVPDDEVYPDGTPEGWGCPTLSNASMRFVDSIVQQSARPVLLWIYAD
jgi:hypothetical protein